MNTSCSFEQIFLKKVYSKSNQKWDNTPVQKLLIKGLLENDLCKHKIKGVSCQVANYNLRSVNMSEKPLTKI